MTRILVRFTCILIAGVLVTSSPGAAGVFDMFKLPDSMASMVKQQTAPQALKIDSYEALMGRLYKLNTEQSIKTLNAELDDRNIDAVTVRVTKLPGYCNNCYGKFSIVRDHGIVNSFQSSDPEISLTYSQIIRMIPYLEDGELDFLDWWQLRAIYLIGGW